MGGGATESKVGRPCPFCGATDQVGGFCTNCGRPIAPDKRGKPRWATRSRLDSDRPPRRWPRLVGLGILFLLFTLCAIVLVVGSVPDATALAVSAAAAVIPAGIYGWLIIRLERYEPEPGKVLLAAFAGGAIGAVVLSVVGSIVFDVAISTLIAPDIGSAFSTVIGAPLVEETFKAVVLLFLIRLFPRELDNTLDGLIYGALIGLGFAMTENILYFGQAYLEGGLRDLGELFLVRAVLNGFGHAVYTGTTGAAIGWARGRYRRGFLRLLAPLLGWCLAVAQHMLWNGGVTYLSVTAPSDARIVSVVFPLALLVTMPAVLLLWTVARISNKRELSVLREQLGPEVGMGVLTPVEYATLIDEPRRRAAIRQARDRGGRVLEKRQELFFTTAAELAFRKQHLQHGEALPPDQRAPEDAYRAELAVLRDGLPVARDTG